MPDESGIPEGTNVEPPGVLESTSLSRPTWVQGVVNDASDEELLAIGALEDAGYSTASSLSSVASTPAKAGRHGDTSREYDDGLSRHAGAALNDAVIAGRFDDDDTSSTLTDQSDLFADFLDGIDDTDDSWLDAYYDSERRQLASGKPYIPDESLADLQRTAHRLREFFGGNLVALAARRPRPSLEHWIGQNLGSSGNRHKCPGWS
jgi:hypothetical protein